MANKNKARTPKRRKRNKRVARDRRGRRLGTSAAHVRELVQDEGLDEREASIAHAAMPGPWRYHTSHWLEAGVQRAVERVGCTALEAIPVIERMQRWAHRVGRVSQTDAALQIAGLELLRRRYGGEPRTIVPPEPRTAMERPVQDMRMGIAQWEAMAYAAAVFDRRDSEAEAEMCVGTATFLVMHLAFSDGVPVRLERLQPSEYVAELRDMAEQEGQAPDELVPQMLACTAELYGRLAEHPRIDGTMCREKAAELGALVMATRGPSYAA